MIYRPRRERQEASMVRHLLEDFRHTLGIWLGRTRVFWGKWRRLVGISICFVYFNLRRYRLRMRDDRRESTRKRASIQWWDFQIQQRTRPLRRSISIVCRCSTMSVNIESDFGSKWYCCFLFEYRVWHHCWILEHSAYLDCVWIDPEPRGVF